MKLLLGYRCLWQKKIGKREFIQHTSKYLKYVAEKGEELILTHRHQPDVLITKIKSKSIKDMKGLITIKVRGDVNEHVLPGYDQW